MSIAVGGDDGKAAGFIVAGFAVDAERGEVGLFAEHDTGIGEEWRVVENKGDAPLFSGRFPFVFWAGRALAIALLIARSYDLL